MVRTVGVLAHALDPQNPAWEQLVWGTPSTGVFGRAAKAIKIALELDAAVLVFPGGAWPGSSVEKSSVHTYAHVRAHALELAKALGLSEPDLLKKLEDIVLLEETALTTQEEIERVGMLFVERGVTQPVLVSSPFHILRAHQLSMEIWKGPPYQPLESAWATSSDTNPEGVRPADTLVFEPAHAQYARAKELINLKQKE